MIETADQDRVRVLTLNRPPSNVLNLELLKGLREEVGRAEADPSVRCLVLASAFPKYFSSGIDLAELLALPEGRRDEPFLALLEAYRALGRFSKPTVAALGGSAILGGWIIAMAADFRVLAEDGKVALSEIRFGLSPTSLLIGRLRALSSSPVLVKEMVLRGKTVAAKDAAAAGLADELAPAGEVLERALRLARGLTKLSPLGYSSVKKALFPEAPGLWDAALEEFRELFGDPQTVEGMEAMRDKRRPKWEN